MGNEQDAEKKQDSKVSVQKWPVLQCISSSDFLVTGLFYNDHPTSNLHYRRFFADAEKIFYKEGERVHYIPLFLTSMEQKFYYLNGERIYALKLTNSYKTTIISTYDRVNFIAFYCVLARFCVLNEFDRHFQVKEQLGRGSYGTVYRGINKFSRQEVALKVFDKSKLKQNTYFKKVVQNQIYLLQKLKKVNLSPLYEVFETPDCIILVLQIAKEGDLINFLLKDDTMVNQQLIKHIFQKILQNLSALHKANIIHRDIKPQNVVVRRNNNQVSLFLCDFSISIVKGDNFCHDMKKMQAGSKGYLAPQVLADNLYTEKCDVFSFGCLAYLLLSGKKLFDGISNSEVIILTQDNEYIHKQVDRMRTSKVLKNLLRKILEVDPNKRISAKEALDEEYFSDKEEELPYLIENDETLKEFIEKRISIYQNTTRGGTTF